MQTGSPNSASPEPRAQGWMPEDGKHLGLCIEFPSLSWLAKTPEAALKGIGKVVAEVVADMQASGECEAGGQRGI